LVVYIIVLVMHGHTNIKYISRCLELEGRRCQISFIKGTMNRQQMLLSLSIAHKVSDKIVLIFKKQLQFTRPMTKTDITTLHSYTVNFLASP